MSRYADRRHAGRALGRVLDSFRERPEVVVLALPRGGVPVAYEVAAALQAPLDIFVARKIGLPSQPELALGAVASGGVQVLNDELIEGLHLSRRMVDAIAEVERREVERRERVYRGGRPPAELFGRTAILVDDGLATGASMKAAVLGCGGWAPRASWWPCRWARPTPAASSRPRPTTWSARRRRSRFASSGNGTRTSPRRRTKRCASCWPSPPTSVPSRVPALIEVFLHGPVTAARARPSARYPSRA